MKGQISNAEMSSVVSFSRYDNPQAGVMRVRWSLAMAELVSQEMTGISNCAGKAINLT